MSSEPCNHKWETLKHGSEDRYAKIKITIVCHRCQSWKEATYEKYHERKY